jgi:hypothetical protein
MTLSSVPVAAASELLRPEHVGTLLVLYVGPDQILPLTSFLGAIVGIILIFWRYVVGLAGRVWRLFSRR